MKSKICFFHSGLTQRRLKDVLAVLRSEGFTTRNQHDFIIFHICKCNKGEENETIILNDNYLDWLSNLCKQDENPKLSILTKVKQPLLILYEEIKEIESKRNDFLNLLRFLQICATDSSFNDVMKQFLNFNFDTISFNSINSSYTVTFTLPIFSDSVNKLVGWRAANLKAIEKAFKCNLRIHKNTENKHVQVELWSRNCKNFHLVKDSLNRQLKEPFLGECLFEFQISATFDEFYARYKLKKLNKLYNCHIKLTRVQATDSIANDALSKILYTVRVYGLNRSEIDVEDLKTILIEQIEDIEAKHIENVNSFRFKEEEEYNILDVEDLPYVSQPIRYSKRFISKVGKKKVWLNNMLRLSSLLL